MKKKSLLTMVVMLFLCQATLFSQSIVDKYGQLTVKGNYIFGKNGDTVQLRGMSLFWSQWMGQYYNGDCVKWLKDDWKCTVVRAAMGAEMGGYYENPEAEKEKVIKVVDAAIANGIYVIIDFHSHKAHEHTAEAKKFFTEMAQKYGSYPNVIYEIFNEPLNDVTWANHIKPYSDTLVQTIRKIDPDNIIVVGTRQWSQLVDEASKDPVKGTNIMYTLHFYAGTHKKWLRQEAERAMQNGIALFVTEYGTCDASGNGKFSPEETQVWFDFMDKYKISHCNWSIADKEETASAIVPGASGKGGWTEEQLTPSGKLVKAEIVKKNTPLLKASKGGSKKAPKKKEKAAPASK